MDERDPLTERVIEAAIEVHRLLGPGTAGVGLPAGA
jgi:hypothetical protein